TFRHLTVFKTAPFDRSGTPPRLRLTAYGALEEEAEVGRPLRQAAHEVGKPLGPVRRGDEHLEPAAGEVELQLGPHAVEHLELEAVARDSRLLREADRVLDDPLVVSRDRRVAGPTERAFD